MHRDAQKLLCFAASLKDQYHWFFLAGAYFKRSATVTTADSSVKSAVGSV